MKPAITDIAGIGPAAAMALDEHGFSTIESLATASIETLAAVPGFSTTRAAKVIAAAGALLPAQANTGDKPEKKAKGRKKDKKEKKGKKGKKDKKDKKGKKGKKGQKGKKGKKGK